MLLSVHRLLMFREDHNAILGFLMDLHNRVAGYSSQEISLDRNCGRSFPRD